MNIFLLENEDFTEPDVAVLTGRRYDHAREILKLAKDANVCIGVVGGKLGTGTVLSCQDGCLKMRVELAEQPPVKHSITLVLALSRPPVFKRVLAAAASMGVETIHIIHTARVEKSYWNSPVLTAEHIHQALILGLEQAQDTVLPQVLLHKRFRPFVEDTLPFIIQSKKCFLAHPEDSIPCPSDISDPMVLAIGPEGGFVDFEIQKFCELGFQAVHLGERILRVETAVQALLGRLLPI